MNPEAEVARGVGLDLVELADFRRRAGRPGFVRRFLGPEELSLLPGPHDPGHYATAALCFAYKEAVLKALGTGAWQQGTTFRDVRVLLGPDPDRPPVVELHDAALKVFVDGGGGRLLLRHARGPEQVWASCLWLGRGSR